MDTNTWLQNTNDADDANERGNGSRDSHGSLGEQIDTALGEFDAKLEQLRDTLDDKKAEIEELEEEIARTEKEQAKAFKHLLSKNTQIKKMLNTGGSDATGVNLEDVIDSRTTFTAGSLEVTPIARNEA